MFSSESNPNRVFALFLSMALVFFYGCAPSSQVRGDEQLQELAQVTHHDEPDLEPTVSPDAQTVAFASLRDGDYNIYLQEAGSRAVVKKTFHPAIDTNPTISPDGTRLAFASDRTGNFDIFVMNMDGGTAKMQLTESDAHDLFPSWSPDGRQVAFSQFSRVDKEWYVWIRDLDNGSLTQVGTGLVPKFSPDGQTLLYKKAGQRGYYELWIRDVNGQNDTQVVSNADWGVGAFDWSPDGSQIIFSTSKGAKKSRRDRRNLERYYRDPRANAQLWMVNRDGSGMTELTAHRGNNTDPAWASDGYVYFASDRGGKVNVWRFRVQAVDMDTVMPQTSGAGGDGSE